MDAFFLSRVSLFALGSEGRERRVVVAAAVGAGDDLARALDLLKVEVGVVGVLEPVEAPLAAGLELGRERGALGPAGDAAVLRARQRPAVLARAAVEEADAAARHHQVEVVRAQVAARVGRLHHHGLAADGAGGEGDPGRGLVG